MSKASMNNEVAGSFAESKAAQVKGMSFEPVVEQCDGCERANKYTDGTYCAVFPIPAAKWRLGVCNMATHKKAESKAAAAAAKVRVGQQKQKKK